MLEWYRNEINDWKAISTIKGGHYDKWLIRYRADDGVFLVCSNPIPGKGFDRVPEFECLREAKAFCQEQENKYAGRAKREIAALPKLIELAKMARTRCCSYNLSMHSLAEKVLEEIEG